MRPYNKNNWKKKIDPAFYKPVKTYLAYLCDVDHLPNEGQITFNDESIELTRKNNNLLADYENEFKIEMLQFDKNVGLITEHESKVFLDTLYAIDEYDKLLRGLKKDCSSITIFRFFKKLYLRRIIQPGIASQMDSLIKLAENLPEKESKQYYVKKINVFIKDVSTKHFFQFQKDFVSIFFSLFIRLFYNKIDECNEESATKEDIEHLNKSIVISKMMGFFNSTMSQISHQKDLPELLNSIKKGDDKSLFKAITTDKTLINFEPVRNRINQAQASGDNEFLIELSKAIAKRPLRKIGQHGKTYAVLNLFWKNNIELHKLNNQELYDFLKSCDLEPPEYPYAFEKFMQRHIN